MNNYDIRIPFPASSVPFTSAKLVNILNEIKTTNSPALRPEIEGGRVELLELLNTDEIQLVEGDAVALPGRTYRVTSRKNRNRGLPAEVAQDAVAGNPMAQAPIPGAPGGGLTRAQVDAMTKAEVQAALATRNVAIKPKNMAEKKLKDLLKAKLG